MNLNEYLQENYTKQTAKAYQREIEIYISNNKKSEHYTYSEIINYIGILRKRYRNPQTINRILASIKAYYSYLCFIRLRNDNPSKSIRLRDKISRDIQLQDLFTTEELETLLTAKKERYKALEMRNKVLISLLIYQALKPQEIEQIQAQDIDLAQATIYIKSSPKNNARTLNLKANQILLFQMYLEQLNTAKSPSFGGVGEVFIPMTANDIAKHIKRNYKLFKNRNLNCQTIRQSVIANLLKQGHDLRIVQAFSGHKYPSTTERYKQNDVVALQQQINVFHPMR